MATLATLKARRSNISKLYEAVYRKFNESLNSPNACNEECELYITKLKEIDTEYLSLCSRIDELDTELSAEEVTKAFIAGQNFSMDLRIIISKAEKAFKQRFPNPSEQSPPQFSPSLANTVACSSNLAVRKLAPLRIERFNGNIFEWIPFWSRFKTRVHDDPLLSPLDKFDYLNMFIGNGVREKIKQIFVSGENYDAAISTLRHEYGREERLIDAYSQCLNGLSRVHSEFDVAGLRHLVLSVKSSVSALNSVGIPTSSISSLFYTKFKSCVPQRLLLDYLVNLDRDS